MIEKIAKPVELSKQKAFFLKKELLAEIHEFGGTQRLHQRICPSYQQDRSGSLVVY